ncbi:MAG: AraC family transcriptional regulator ligand-binding domain-containing protein [Allosphingosinicella sp.]
MLPQVRAAALTNYFEVARFVGLDPYEMLRRQGISPQSLTDPEQLIAIAPASRLLEESARESGCISFGLHMAESRSAFSVGAVSLLLQHERSARALMEALVQYQSMLGEAFAFSLEEADGVAIFHTDIVGGLAGRQAIELMMAVTYKLVTAFVSGDWRPESAHFVHDAPPDLAVHRRIFDCPLVFASDFNGFVCGASSMDVPNPAAQPIMAEHARRYLDMLAPAPDDGRIVTRARRSLQLLLPAGRASLEQVGATLGLHARALQRLLEKEKQTYASLLNDVRRELALRYLSTSSRSVTSVAALTGYSTPSAFARWFSAEFGLSPAAWRAAEQRRN